MFVCVQMDLEPEGKVYVLITLNGSFTDGKAGTVGSNAALCFSLWLFIPIQLLLLFTQCVTADSFSHRLLFFQHCLVFWVLIYLWAIEQLKVCAPTTSEHACIQYLDACVWIEWSQTSEGINKLLLSLLFFNLPPLFSQLPVTIKLHEMLTVHVHMKEERSHSTGARLAGAERKATVTHNRSTTAVSREAYHCASAACQNLRWMGYNHTGPWRAPPPHQPRA